MRGARPLRAERHRPAAASRDCLRSRSARGAAARHAREGRAAAHALLLGRPAADRGGVPRRAAGLRCRPGCRGSRERRSAGHRACASRALRGGRRAVRARSRGGAVRSPVGRRARGCGCAARVEVLGGADPPSRRCGAPGARSRLTAVAGLRGLMRAIVMAAGEARACARSPSAGRSRSCRSTAVPSSRRCCDELRAAGCDHVTVVTGHLAEQVEALLGDGSAFRVGVTFVRQPRADGSADAVRRALEAGAEAPTLVVGADTVFEPGSLATFVRAWAAPGAVGARAGGGKAGIRIDGGRVTRLVDPTATELTSLPLWGLGAEGRPAPRPTVRAAPSSSRTRTSVRWRAGSRFAASSAGYPRLDVSGRPHHGETSRT